MKSNSFLATMLIVLLSGCFSSILGQTIEIGGFYYEPIVENSKLMGYCLVPPPDGSSYSGDVKIPNTIEVDGGMSKVNYIEVNSFVNSDITSLVLPNSFTFKRKPQSSETGSSDSSSDNSEVLASNSFTIGGSSSVSTNKEYDKYPGDKQINTLRSIFHEAFDSCWKLQTIKTWDAEGKEVIGDGHVYYEVITKPYSNYTDSSVNKWHVYTPKNTPKDVIFEKFGNSPYKTCYFRFSTDNFTDYPHVESIDFPDKTLAFTLADSIDMNCPKLIQYKLDGVTKYHNCLEREVASSYVNPTWEPRIYAIPPGLSTLVFKPRVKLFNEDVIKNSNVKKLIFTSNDVTIPSVFDGDVYLSEYTDNLASQLAAATCNNSANTIWCDPLNANEIQELWAGRIEFNNFYLKDVKIGTTSLSLEFGGEKDNIEVIKDIKLISKVNKLSVFSGVATKISDTKWEIQNGDQDFVGIFLVGNDTELSHPLLSNARDERKTYFSSIDPIATIKQRSVKFKITFPENEYITDLKDAISDYVNKTSGLTITKETSSEVEVEMRDLEPGYYYDQAFLKIKYPTFKYYDGNFVEDTHQEKTLISKYFQTNSLTIEPSYVSTQSSVTFSKINVNFDDSWPKDKIKKIFISSSIGGGGIGEQLYIDPALGDNPSAGVSFYVGDDNMSDTGSAFAYLDSYVVKLKPVYNPAEITPTTLSIPRIKGDAKVKSEKIFCGELDSNEYVEGSLVTSLPRRHQYYYSFVVTFERPNGGTIKRFIGSEKKATIPFYIPNLKLSTEQPRIINKGEVIVVGQVNTSDREPNIGFQWKKYDAPASLKPSEAYCGLYEGKVEGYIKNLSPDHYYNVRLFYHDKAGKYTYGDWVTFDPSDFSYFEPNIHTYSTNEVTYNTALLFGYIMRGSEEITEQGFEYGKVTDLEKEGDSDRTRAASISSLVSIEGQQLQYNLENLDPETEYWYRAYAVTPENNYFGEIQYFKTDASPVGGVKIIENEAISEEVLVGVYDLFGRKVRENHRGICIEIYSTGRTKKVYRK